MSSIERFGFELLASIKKDFAYFKFMVSSPKPFELVMLLEEVGEYKEVVCLDFQGVLVLDSWRGGKKTV